MKKGANYYECVFLDLTLVLQKIFYNSQLINIKISTYAKELTRIFYIMFIRYDASKILIQEKLLQVCAEQSFYFFRILIIELDLWNIIYYNSSVHIYSLPKFGKRWKFIKLITLQYLCNGALLGLVFMYIRIEYCIQDNGISVLRLIGALVLLFTLSLKANQCDILLIFEEQTNLYYLKL